jgi:opacity protein-like surface antigen
VQPDLGAIQPFKTGGKRVRSYLFTATALLAVATPAAASNDHGYVGIEAGLLFPSNQDFDVTATNGAASLTDSHGLGVDYSTSFDGDFIAGYDFGMLRLEAEAGWKRPNVSHFNFSNGVLAGLGGITNSTVTDSDIGLNDKFEIITGMMNGLIDFDLDRRQTISVYAGGGIGSSWVKAFGADDGSFAWQAIAGLRFAVSRNVDVGVKYRYFQTNGLNFRATAVDVNGTPFAMDLAGRFHSHSILASLIYNFGVEPPPPPPPPPPPAPPPPPPPPATQTCPDGTIILATDACPAPPPPPPPPPPAPERG